MTILLAVSGFDATRWRDALERAMPGRSVTTDAGVSGIRYAVVWKQPPGLLAKLPDLRAVFSLGAGVDHILRDPDLPEVPIARIVAPDLSARMSEYVVWRVLDHHRRGMAYRAQQAAGLWHERIQPAAGEITVGIMGLGALGRDAAGKLKSLGFRLAGWSRRPQDAQSIATFHGEEGLGPFLAETDILVVLLPITAETRGILNIGLFRRMKRATPLGGPVLINAGRGALQIEADILAALNGNLLMEASLDVFETEPLPAASPLWKHPRVFVTPHAAAASDPEALAPLIAEQVERAERGEALQHLVDRSAGY